jgi:type VI secretion system protein VasD
MNRLSSRLLKIGSHVANAVLFGRLFLILAIPALALQGCAGGAASAVSLVANVAMQAAGLKDKGPPPPKMIPLRIDAGTNLNSDDEGHGYAVVARIYKLRDAASFMSAPQSVFGDPAREREALGDSLLEVREVVLTPGQNLESSERMTSEMAYLGIVVLFRSPAPERWRVAFAQADVQKSGITMGAHGCAISVSEGKVYGMNASQAALLSPVVCHNSVGNAEANVSTNSPSPVPNN